MYWEGKAIEYFHKQRILDPLSLHIVKKGKEWHRPKMENDIWIVRLFKERIENDEENKMLKEGNQEIITAHDFFKNRSKLSVKDGKFCLIEHVDEYPLFINNFGMASKLIRYLYVPNEQNAKAKNSHIGPYGIEIPLSSKDKLPLIGQIDQALYKGICIVENNMYRSPVFFHVTAKDDFILIKHKNTEGRVIIFCNKCSGHLH